MRKSMSIIAVTAIFLITSNTVFAQVIWNFNSSSPSNSTLSHVTIAAATQQNNNGSTTFIASNAPASSAYTGASGGSAANFSAKTGAVNTSTSTYIEITITPDSGYVVKVSDISWGNYSVSTSGPNTLTLYNNLDNYASSFATASALQNSTWALLNPAFTAFSSLHAQPLKIRIYASGGSGSTPAAGAVNWKLDDLKITAKALPVSETIFMSMKYSSSPSAALPWNNVEALNTNSLLSSTGTPTSVGLEFLMGSWSNTGNAGMVTGNNSGVYPDDVIRDYYWFGAYSAPDSMLANLKGLDTSSTYNITFFGSSAWTGLGDNGTTVYHINGNQKPLYVDSNYLNTVTFSGIKPNASGIIQFKMTKGAYTPYGLVNAIVLEKLYDSVIHLEDWHYGGNTVGTVQKIGTIDSLNFPIITNNIERMTITANGDTKMYGSLSAGSNSSATGFSSMALGSGNISSGYGSVSIGEQAKALGSKSIAIGGSAFGMFTQALKPNSIAISGNNASADGDASIVIGSSSRTKANYSLALGYGLVAQSAGSVVIGVYNDTTTAGSLTNFGSETRVLQVGAGTNAARKNAITVMYGGNVGVGTNLPDSVLHLKGGFKYDHPTAGAGKVLTSDANGGATWQDGNGGGQWTSSGNNTYHTDTTGTVFIGMQNNTDNNYRLFVEKGIRTRKVKVDQANWPDYVFNNDYELPSLLHVEEFINKNKHLPGVPSAAEIEKNGADIGEIQSVLLKKIEELTLYIIQLDKKVEQLTKENAALKKQ